MLSLPNFTMTWKDPHVRTGVGPPNAVVRFVSALSFLALGLGVRWALDPWLGDTLSHPTIFIAVLLTTWYCGTRPALLVAVIGYPAIEYLIRDLPFSGGRFDYLAASLGLYMGLVWIIIFFVSTFRREHDELSTAERQLTESEQRIRACFENAALGIVEIDTQDRFVAVNERMCRILRYSRNELVGRYVQDVTAPTDRVQARELMRKLHTGELDHLDYESPILAR